MLQSWNRCKTGLIFSLQGYVNSGVAITMSLKCMINSDVEDNTDIHVMLDDFLAAASKAFFLLIELF